MTYKPSTEPESLTQLLGRSFSLYCHSFLEVFYIALGLSLIVFIPRFIDLAFGKHYLASIAIYSPISFSISALLIDVIILSFLLMILWRFQCHINNIHEPLKEDLRVTSRKLPLVIVGCIIQSLLLTAIFFVTLSFYIYLHKNHLFLHKDIYAITLTALPLIFAAALYVYLFYLLYFYLPIILTENAGVFRSFAHSAYLVWQNWWRTFWTQIIPWLCYLCVLIILKYGTHMNLHIYLSNDANQSLLATLVQLLIFILFVPWIAATILVQLHDLELRKK